MLMELQHQLKQRKKGINIRLKRH